MKKQRKILNTGMTVYDINKQLSNQQPEMPVLAIAQKQK
jgi:hypothetical protein